jgi:nanoRNase/pAp phosphatase (c-di-AMP/oligoRNAs hydrolase)
MAEEQNQNMGEMERILENVRSSENILIALNNNPTIDELATSLALTLALDKLGKHATAIFSGKVPDQIEFLDPEKTFETNTNSLQDFIIALNKDKADHLRYKIDGDFVKVFITPYRTTIDESDLEFSHGEYNIDLVIALDVKTVDDLDKALSEHGRIMHNAKVVNISSGEPGRFGDVVWTDAGVSSIAELVARVIDGLEGDAQEGGLVDKAIAQAILTGLVAATERFSNSKTTPEVMTLASKMMSLGADQQTVAQNLAKAAPAVAPVAPAPAPVPSPEVVIAPDEPQPKKQENLVIEHTAPTIQEIQHMKEAAPVVAPVPETPKPAAEQASPAPTTTPNEFLTPNKALVGTEEEDGKDKVNGGGSYVYEANAHHKAKIEPIEEKSVDEEAEVEKLLGTEGQVAEAPEEKKEEQQGGQISGLPMPPEFDPNAPMVTPPDGAGLPPIGDAGEFRLPA